MAQPRRIARSAALLALGAALLPRPASSALSPEAGPWEVQVLVAGRPAPTYRHRGETWVLGERGQRYEIRVSNRSDHRIEVVVSVDGRDVMDGEAAEYRTRRGYLVPARGVLDIDGWRISREQAAAFRFSSVAGSYAARTGSARDVGVIGVAVFPELPQPVLRRREAARERWDAAPPAGASKQAEAGPMPDLDAEAGGAPAPEARPGLGTEYGEARSSPVHEVEFVRADPTRPAALLGLRYNDARGLRSMGIRLEPDPFGQEDEARLRRSADPFPGERRYAPPPPGWRSVSDAR